MAKPGPAGGGPNRPRPAETDRIRSDVRVEQATPAERLARAGKKFAVCRQTWPGSRPFREGRDDAQATTCRVLLVLELPRTTKGTGSVYACRVSFQRRAGGPVNHDELVVLAQVCSAQPGTGAGAGAPVRPATRGSSCTSCRCRMGRGRCGPPSAHRRAACRRGAPLRWRRCRLRSGAYRPRS